jgi:hypothetical protein
VVLFLALGGLRGGKSWEISRENPEIGEMMVAGWWFGTFFLKFFHILEIVTPTDELIFFRGVGLKPPTRCFFSVFYA